MAVHCALEKNCIVITRYCPDAEIEANPSAAA